MTGAFYQSWDLDEEGGMIGIIDREFNHSAEASKEVIEHINRLIDEASNRPDAAAFLSTFTGDYDPSYDGMQALEWFTLLKAYLQGNKDAFNKTT